MANVALKNPQNTTHSTNPNVEKVSDDTSGTEQNRLSGNNGDSAISNLESQPSEERLKSHSNEQQSTPEYSREKDILKTKKVDYNN